MLCCSRPASALLCLLTFFSVLPLHAQTPGADLCSMPVFSHSGLERNLFNDQQEEWLGELMDQSLKKDYHLIEDRDGYLQRIGERLLAQLPATGVRYRFVIIDSPGMNSFGTAGGRIYIYRRMIAYAKNEDQLAGLLGHEIGHMIMHQYAIQMSEWFRKLGITSIGDRQDVLNRWNQFKDNAAKIKVSDDWRAREEQEQVIADRIAVYAMMRAGYDPFEFSDFADKTFQTKGKTGNFWTDLFGATSPESKRLRQIIKESDSTPANCRAPHPDTATFAKWQQSIVEANRAVAREELPGLIKKTRLQPPLRSEIENLRFSPDGKYLLAQDESSIFVLRREPFSNLFTIDAEAAYAASFTPDSKSIVFFDPELRVQKWDIATGGRVFIQEVRAECTHRALSPAGDLLACVTDDRELQIVEVQSGTVSTLKKNLYEQTGGERHIGEILSRMGLPGRRLEVLQVALCFSPDGRYLVAGHGAFMFAYDFVNRREVKVPGKLQPLMEGTFVFIAPDEIFGLTLEKPRQAMRMQFPSGEIQDKFPFPGWGFLSAVPNTPYAMIRPAGQAPIGAIDFSAKKVTLGYKTQGFAIFDKFFAGEDIDGQLVVYSLETKSPLARVQLPISFLTAPKTSAFSLDNRWLAVSTRSRGAVWKLENGERVVYSRDFNSAFFEQDHLIVQFPKHKTLPAQVVQLNPLTLAETKLYDLEPEEDESQEPHQSQDSRTRTWQSQDLLLSVTPAEAKKSSHLNFEVRDIKTRELLWELDPIGHWVNFHYSQPVNTMTFVISNYDEIKEAAKRIPGLNARLDAIHGSTGKHTAYLVDVFEARSHKELGAVLVDTGNLSFKVRFAAAVGDNVFVSDSLNRTLVYSLASGEQRGKVFGRVVAISKAGDRALVESEPGVGDLYDALNLQSVDHFTFSSRLTHAEFVTSDNLLVLSADQTVYQLNLAPPQAQKASSR